MRETASSLFDFPTAPEAAPHDGQSNSLPIVPLADTVLFPYMLTSLFLSQPAAILAVEEALAGDRMFLAVAQRRHDGLPEDAEALYGIGVEAVVQRMLKMPDGAISVMVQGRHRVRLGHAFRNGDVLRAAGERLHEPSGRTLEIEAMMRAVLSLFERVVRLSRRMPDDTYVVAMNVSEPGWLADLIAATLPLDTQRRQEVLEIFDPEARLKRVSLLLTQELDVLELESRIRVQVQREVDRSQREFFLREQIKAMQRELGQIDPLQRELIDLQERVTAAGMPERVQQKATAELERMEHMPPAAPEYSMLRAYLDWLIDLPWTKQSDDSIDLAKAACVLDQNHYGLQDVKERILEFLAARQLAGSRLKAPILCFVGPPGVGKTSLGRSIADALGRRFVRMALGGVHDEAEIRGHRRTYIGALPGRIVKAMKEAGTLNPVIVLDEVDKLGRDLRGDPASALLEVLDPEQNHTFVDHYLDVPYDLSRVMFITTANLLDTVPPALRDRMEVVALPGYTEEEKLQIARRFLVPRQLAANGLAFAAGGRSVEPALPDAALQGDMRMLAQSRARAAARKPTAHPEGFVRIGDAALRAIISGYTYEAGVRELERAIASICRKVARRIAEQRDYPKLVRPATLQELLGAPRYTHGYAEAEDTIGVATGLSWTVNGGDVIAVEVTLMKGSGQLLLTGHLGDVMKESARAALSYARASAVQLGVKPRRFESMDIHIHVPQGAVPKDGPSAGITLATALISAVTGRPVRRDVAMTGEITLRGRVLPVGGIKEKALGAYRAGITTVVLPRGNERDLDLVPAHVRRKTNFVLVGRMEEVLVCALCPPSEDPPEAP